jgi:uncharacterized membrane protein YfhO
MGKSEYLPENAYNNEFYVASRESDEVLILKGSGEVSETQKTGNTLTCKIETIEDNTVFEFPYIYYPGYTVKIDGQEVASYEDENGFLAISINTLEKSDVLVEYTGTSLMNYSKAFSVGSIIICIVYIWLMRETPVNENDKIKEKE